MSFGRAMQVVAEEQAAAAAAAAAKRETRKQRQISKVLEASRLRAERATRVAKLKVTIHSPYHKRSAAQNTRIPFFCPHSLYQSLATHSSADNHFLERHETCCLPEMVQRPR